jgi:hypothetical protein
MKITSLTNVDTVPGSHKITFTAITDGGANETVSTTLEGTKCSTVINGAGAAIDGSITHDKSGLHSVTLVAETSGVSSLPLVLNL